MRFVLDALRRFGWLPLVLAAAGALGAYLVESRSRSALFVAVAELGGRRSAELVNDPDAAVLAAALAAAHRDETVPDGYWKTANEGMLRDILQRKDLLVDPARWPEVRLVDEPPASVVVAGEKVTASAGDPAGARRAANARAKAAELLGESRRRAAADRVESLRTRMEIAELEAGPVEDKVREMERRMAALQGSAEAIERQVEDVRSRQEQAKARIRALEALEHRLREALPAGPEENGLSSPLYEKLSAERESVRAERALKMAGRTAEDPEIKRLAGRMADLELEIRKELYLVRERTIVRLRNSLDAMDAEMRSLDERRLQRALDVRVLSEEIRAAGPLRAETERLRGDLEAAEKRLAELGSSDIPLAVLAAEAVETTRRGGVRPGVAVWTSAAGLAAGLLLAFALRGADRRVRSGDDVKRRLGVGVLGLAAEVKGDPLLLRAAPGSEVSADYSLAAGVLRGYMAEREFRVVLVTSAAAGEGKSTAAANLAVALARKGMSVALVDADLRAPRQASIFGLDDAQGLSTLLLGAELQPDLPAGATDLATLRVLTAGPTAELPAEILESARTAEILRALRERYEAVVVDAPPLTVGGDAVSLARVADTVAWVVRAGHLPSGRLGWVRHVLKNVGADVAGVLLVGASQGAAEREYRYPAEARAR